MDETLKTPRTNIFYPASYLVTVITSLLFLGAVGSLGAILIDYWLNGVSNILTDYTIFYFAASLIVVLPLHLLAYWQVRHTDKSQVTLFSLRFSHGLLGAYLFLTVGSIIVFSTWLLALWFNAVLGTGNIDKHLLAASLGLLQAIGWSFYATVHFQRSRVNLSRPKYYALTISLLSAIVLLVTLAFPALAYRDVARDSVKEADLAKVQQAIGDYVDTRNTLPAQLHELHGLDKNTTDRLSEYQYTPEGETKFGIFGYTLCATFARSNGEGRVTGFGFNSHGSGKQCFTRTTISFTKLNQDLAQYSQNLDNGALRLQSAIRGFLLGAKGAVDQEISGVESFASGQVKQLESNLEGLDGGTTQLQQEMERLEGNLTGLQGNTGQLAQDFAAVEQFFHDLGCLFGGCSAN